MGYARPKTSPPVDTSGAWRAATIMALNAGGTVEMKIGDATVRAVVATHLPALVPGQRVLAACPHDAEPLIVAAYPLAGEASATSKNDAMAALRYDAETGTLGIEAKQLKLQGLSSVEIRCGEAVLRFNAQGEVFMQGEAITQSAIGPCLIEGASIDLN
jgi:hypothetical protein